MHVNHIAIRVVARVFMGKKRNFVGQSFWARGYYVSTVGRDEQVVREYIRNQESGSGREAHRSVGSIALRIS